MAHVITKSGFECEVDDAAMNDWDVLEKLALIADNDLKAFVEIPALLLKPEDIKRLREHVTENGHVLANRMITEVTEIIEAFPNSKK